MSTQNLDKIETFINDTNNNIIDSRGAHSFAQNITTSIAWSMAAAYNSGIYFLNNLNKQLAEAIDENNEERAEQIRDLMAATEKNNEEARDAYAWAYNYIPNTTGKKNTLDPSPKAIIPQFTQSSDNLEDYKPSQEMIDTVKKYVNVSDKALEVAIAQKALDSKEAAEEMAKWTSKHQNETISQLNQAIKKEKALVDLSDNITLRIWEKIDNKLAEYTQKAIVAMLGRNAKMAQAAMQNIEHFEFAQQIASGFVDMYYNLITSDNQGKEA